MKVYLKELKFPSTIHTYIDNITDKVNAAIKKSKLKDGFVVINALHTTLGILVHEISEPNLLEDILHHSLSVVPEDKRSTKVHKQYKHPVVDYRHRCQDNPYCNEIDEDYNAGAHIRALTYSHASVTLPFRKGKLELGKYQEVAAFEFDGRDGTGKNPIRQRVIQIWIHPVDEVVEL
jgi:thiamine phosphate synthase YjbQ (UPF0047 family)